MSSRVTLIAILAIAGVSTAQAQSDPLYLTTNLYLGAPVTHYDARVSPYSPYGALNQYTSDGGRIYGQDGTYLGRLNANRYDSESVANPYGRYGSPYSATSINNPYGAYGSPYSGLSAQNPFAATPPVVYYEEP